jgi:poly(3-hydroxybutyrate) depolymerase
VDLGKTSVSGLSSGGFMAAQFHVANSETLIGAGIIAGGPFYCAGAYRSNSYLENATTLCMHPFGPAPDGRKLYAKAEGFAQASQIDPVANLKDDKVYLFSGESDQTVTTPVVDQTLAFYRAAGVPAANIQYLKTVDAGHAIVTDNGDDSACAITKPPFINDCDFVQSQALLRHLYGALNAPAKTPSGRVLAFDQREFIGSARASMGDVAYAYIPKSCDTETCKVHVAFHGCQQGASQIGDRYYTTTGYNEIADTNNMIVLYPQAEPSPAIPFNPKGCWDFWGYSSPDQTRPNFYSKKAPQMAAVRKMLDRLAGPRRPAEP